MYKSKVSPFNPVMTEVTSESCMKLLDDRDAGHQRYEMIDDNVIPTTEVVMNDYRKAEKTCSFKSFLSYRPLEF